jgi:hypothetical protein
MKKIKYIFSISIIVFILISVTSIFPEGYNLINPHIDTKFAKDFNVESFEKIKNGMYKKDVEKLIGKPLMFSNKIISSIQPKNSMISVYASDGKCQWGDFAWESFDVYFNYDERVIGKSRRWWYD